MKKFKIRSFNRVTDELLDALVDLERGIFEDPYSRKKIELEARNKHNFSAFVAFSNGLPCGFKVGYELNSKLYYSWIGGVAPEYQGYGIAKSLMASQHEWARTSGYTTIQTRTENRFRPMLILNIKSGFDVVGLKCSGDPRKTIIILEKKLV